MLTRLAIAEKYSKNSYSERKTNWCGERSGVRSECVFKQMNRKETNSIFFFVDLLELIVCVFLNVGKCKQRKKAIIFMVYQ